MSIHTLHEKFRTFFLKIEDLPALLLRIILAYVFYAPAMNKFSDIPATAGFFEYLGIPFATLSAYLTAGVELAGAVLLTLGLMTRFICVPLLVIMAVAILTVHGPNGFDLIMAGDGFSWDSPYINGEQVAHTVVVLQNGYEMVLYYSVMLMVLLSRGAGRLSLDFLIFKKA